MVKMRQLSINDIPSLEAAIARDTFHPGEWKVPHFFNQPNCPASSHVIEDDKGPIAFVRYTKTLRVSCVWNDGEDFSRNARAIIYGIKQSVEMARRSGFTEIVIKTSHSKLAEFLTRVIGMTKDDGEYLLAV